MNWPFRTAQWIIALHLVRQRIPWRTMILAILSGPVPRAVWRQRMRYGCYECPLFNHDRLTCRGVIEPYDQHGCDCFVPYSALTAEPYPSGCYGRAKFGEDFGWGAYRFPSWWDRIIAPIRFALGK